MKSLRNYCMVPLVVIAFSSWSTAQGPVRSRPAPAPAAAGVDVAGVTGKWTYRSFVSDPNLSTEPNDLLFGSGTLDLSVGAPNVLTGTLGGPGWQLSLTGKVVLGTPVSIRFTGRGTIGGEEWVYDYLGYAVPAWPSGVDQRPAIVGSIVRTKAHSGGAATAGVVAQWIAVQQWPLSKGTTPSPVAAVPMIQEMPGPANLQPKKELPSETLLRQKYLQESPLPEATGAMKSLKLPTPVAESPPRLAPAPTEVHSSGGRLDVTLDVDYGTAMVGNDEVRLRMYNQRLIGPTLRVKAGDVIYITLNNRLPVESGSPHVVNGHHAWNTTNLHFHGLHVSPQGPVGVPDAESDNVLLELPPSNPFNPAISTKKYQVRIPPDHVAGTFWYHAHKHGSTAVQVSSGMAGALIVERSDATHNLDVVPQVAAAHEEIMVLQEIPYLKDSPLPGKIERSSPTAPDPNENDVRMFSPGSFRDLRRYITVNGAKVPVIEMAPGEVRRLRLIYTGQREPVHLRVERAPGTTTTPEFLTLHEIAIDGLPTGSIRAIDPAQTEPRNQALEMYPGYRSDVLLKAPAAGDYYLVDLQNDTTVPRPDTGADGSPELLRWVARIHVTGAPLSMALPPPASLAPHRLTDLLPTAVTGTQYAFYGLELGLSPIGFFISRDDLSTSNTPVSTANAESYDATHPRVLPLDATERWLVGSRNRGAAVVHPFHIHVNPFLIQKVTSFVETGSVGTAKDVTAREIGSATWRDTLAMKHGFTYELLTRYQHFEGDFVDHCHILDHEDNGMMELVRIQGGTPSPAPAATTDSPLGALRGQRAVVVLTQGLGCPACVDQLKQLTSRLSNATIVAVIPDQDTDAAKVGLKDLRVISDPGHVLYRALGAFTDKPLHGVAVLDAGGKIVFRVSGDEPWTDVATLQTAINNASGGALGNAAVAADCDCTTTSTVTRIRKNIDCLTPGELDVYKHAIQIVKQRSAMNPSDPTGFDWQVRVHGSPLVGPCKHNTELIWPWHRAMLFYFEETLRATDPDHPTLSTRNLTIPYWDWTRQPSGSSGYPAAYEDAASPLFHAGRNTWGPLNPAPIFSDADVGLALPTWDLFGGTTSAAGQLEFIPHNAGHGSYVGGDMAFPSTSPKDPIFWSHHANLDRLWDLWQQTHGVNPTQQTTPLRGWPSTVSPPAIVSSFNDIRLQLGYDYCNPDVSREFELSPSAEAAPQLTLKPGTPRPSLAAPSRRSTAQVRLKGVSIPIDFSYTVRVFLYPNTVKFEPKSAKFSKTYLAARFVVWANDIADHGGMQRIQDLNLDVSQVYDAIKRSGVPAVDLSVSLDVERNDRGKISEAAFNSPGIGFKSARLVLDPDNAGGR